MKGLTRYEVTGGDGPANAYEASDGEWVLFSDVERLLSAVPPQVPDDVALDAARYRYIRASDCVGLLCLVTRPELHETAAHVFEHVKAGTYMDDAIDAAMLAAAQKGE